MEGEQASFQVRCFLRTTYGLWQHASKIRMSWIADLNLTICAYKLDGNAKLFPYIL